jgi:bifunctional DNA-binding transcriptional regulator/antitoxin component of YhaV-PrlF toxin-antitoxin module
VTRISTQNQVTLPTDALAQAGLAAGDRLRASVRAPGQILLVREVDPIEKLLGALPGVYPPGYLDELRDEWR